MSEKVDDTTIVRSINEDVDGYITGYMCTIDWEFELGAACGGNKIYPSINDLKENRACWKQCGITEVKVKFNKTVCNGFDYKD